MLTTLYEPCSLRHFSPSFKELLFPFQFNPEKKMWKDKTFHLFSLGFLGICPSGSGGLWFGNKPETEKDVRIFCSVSLLLLHSEVTLHLISQATQVTTGTAQHKLKYSRKGILSSVTAERAPQLEEAGSCAGYREEIHSKDNVTWAHHRSFYRGHWCPIRFHLQNGKSDY